MSACLFSLCPRDLGQTGLVTRILEALAAQLTDGGDVTPILNSRSDDRITVEDFVEARKRKPHVCHACLRGLLPLTTLSQQVVRNEGDIYASLTDSTSREE